MTKDQKFRQRVAAEYQSLRKSGHIGPDDYPPSVTRGAPPPSWLTPVQRERWLKALAWWRDIMVKDPRYYLEP